MVRVAILLLALLAAPAVHAAADESVGGVEKVIAMLQDMSAKAKQAKKDEEVSFAQFNTWCAEESKHLAAEIVREGEEIELLTSNIAKLNSDVSVLADEIAALKALVVKSEDDLAAQKAERATDNKNFLAEQNDYGESVSALERAILVLSKQSYDRKGAAAVLLQLSTDQMIPDQAKSMVAAFLGMMSGNDPELLQSMAVPEANAYEFQSGGIVDMLKKLNAEFVAKKGQCEKEEMNSAHAYNMVVADLTDTVENSNKEIDSKTGTKESKQEQAALDTKQLAATVASKKEDESTLSDMDTECKEKSLSYDEKQQLRAEEIEAIGKAIEILSGDDVSGNAGKHLDLAQTATGTAFAQIRGTNNLVSEGVHLRVREFIASEGARLKSKRLALLSQTLAANPFGKVKKLIDDMITRLLEEANEDASHEGFCDKEMGESKITRNKLNEEIDALQAAVEDGKATIMMLSQDIATLETDVADLEAAMTAATEMRTAEKAKNKATVADSLAAQNAVQAATAVLKDFYTKAAMATGLIQTSAGRPIMGSPEWQQLANPNFKGTVDKGHKAGMQTFGASAKGQQDEAGGVLAMLQVILSDFAQVESETKSAENMAQDSYDGFMTEAKKNSRVKSKKSEMNAADKVAAEAKLREDVADLKNTQDELLAAERYYDKLVPQCIDKGMTFEERTAAREEEIASLKQALEILSSQGSVA